MRDPRAVLGQAAQGAAPSDWAVFTKKRGRVRGFLTGRSDDPDPLLVITPEGVAEFVDSRSPVLVVGFDDVAAVELRVRGHSFSDSTIVTLDVWIDLNYHDGRKKTSWRSSSFRDDVRTIQAFLEAFGAYKALRRGRRDPVP
jgi:hypothetical protein